MKQSTNSTSSASKTTVAKNIVSQLTPILGAGAVGACPICWIGSASLLTYVGLGALIPIWQWLVVVLLAVSLIGFFLDYRSHRNVVPLLILVAGGVLLYLGRYVFGGDSFTGWPIWGPGVILMFAAVITNKRQFAKRPRHRQDGHDHHHHHGEQHPAEHDRHYQPSHG